MVFARRASPCSSLPTLPTAASAMLASSPCEECYYCFWVKPSQLSIRTYRYMSDILRIPCRKITGGQKYQVLPESTRSGVRSPECFLLFFGGGIAFFHLFLVSIVVCAVSQQSIHIKIIVFGYTCRCSECCYTAVAAAALLLLAAVFVIVYRMAKLLLWSSYCM